MRILVVIYLLCMLRCYASAKYTNQWAVDIYGGPEEADLVAKETGCINDGVILENTYLLTCHHVSKRSTEPHLEVHTDLNTHSKVSYADQQVVKSRTKRQLWTRPRPPQQQQSFPPQTQFDDLSHFNDQRWAQMWYLNRGNKLDMNVQEAWQMGATGKGIAVTILDDGIERTHPDLVANYDPLASFDVNQNDNDPTPRYDLIDSNRHGTRCAGEVAATANNSNCAVGIAYGAGIGGVRMLDGDVTDAVEARSLGLNNQHIHIYSASWGPDDDGKTVDGPGRLATRAFLQGISQGRGGKGSIFVWASGNGGRDYDNCNCDGYTNSIWTLSVSSATENGLIPWYSEACSSTMATTYSSGSSGERKVVTTDLHHTCTSTHTGTSASAPLAAGIIALILEVNPELTWRDVQHVTVRCAHNANLRANDWSQNAVGRNFSHSFGYGLMDAACMVRLAKQWTSVPDQLKCSRGSEKSGSIFVQGGTSQKSTIHVSDCDDNLSFIEHVQAHVTLGAAKRGDVRIYLTSPKGTKSLLIAKRPKDYSRAGFNDWPFLTVHMWEESPIGDWTLEVINDGRSIVELKKWSLAFFGTKDHPQPNIREVPRQQPNEPSEKDLDLNQVPDVPIQKTADVTNMHSKPLKQSESVEEVFLEHCLDARDPKWCSICESGFLMLNGRCLESCPAEGYYQGTENHQDSCLQCYYSCKTCNGPNDYQCISCYGDAELEESESHKYCHNKSLINKVFSSTRWYYVLTIGFLVNFFIVVFLVIYIIQWRRKHHHGRLMSVNLESPTTKSGSVNGTTRKKSWGSNGSAVNNNRGYSPVKSGTDSSSMTTVPFHDYESTSEDEELFRKPFTDHK
eukprot:05555.XXX_231746_225773_1 [CDS] Oithona nana genome sequencing.